MTIPTEKKVEELYKKYDVPNNIKAHMKKVTQVATFLGTKLNESGEKVNLKLLKSAASLHDIAKYITLKNGGHHGELGLEILSKEGYCEIGELVKSHTNDIVLEEDGYQKWFKQSIEKKLLNYADFRVLHEKITSLDKRFEYLYERYPKSNERFNILTDILKEFENWLVDKGIDIQIKSKK